MNRSARHSRHYSKTKTFPKEVLGIVQNVAKSVGALFEAEYASTEPDGKTCVKNALGTLSQTLALLQDVKSEHSGVQSATESIADVISILFPLTNKPSVRPEAASRRPRSRRPSASAPASQRTAIGAALLQSAHRRAHPRPAPTRERTPAPRARSVERPRASETDYPIECAAFAASRRRVRPPSSISAFTAAREQAAVREAALGCTGVRFPTSMLPPPAPIPTGDAAARGGEPRRDDAVQLLRGLQRRDRARRRVPRHL